MEVSQRDCWHRVPSPPDSGGIDIARNAVMLGVAPDPIACRRQR